MNEVCVVCGAPAVALLLEAATEPAPEIGPNWQRLNGIKKTPYCALHQAEVEDLTLWQTVKQPELIDGQTINGHFYFKPHEE